MRYTVLGKRIHVRKGLTGLENTIVRIIRNESASFIAEAHKTKCVKRYLAKGSRNKKGIIGKRPNTLYGIRHKADIA